MQDSISYHDLIRRGWSKRLICQQLLSGPIVDETGNRVYLRNCTFPLETVKKAEQQEDVKAEIAKIALARESSAPYAKEHKKMIEHNESIIEDNLFFGQKQIMRGESTEEEVQQYKTSAFAQLKAFKAFLRQGGTPVYNTSTDMYEIPSAD